MAEFRNGVMQAMYYDNSVKSSIKKGVRGEFLQKTGDSSKNLLFMTRDELMKFLNRHQTCASGSIMDNATDF